MVTKYFKPFLAFIALFITLGVFAQNYPQPQNPPRIVNDFARVFSDSESQMLEQKLRAFNDTTSTQIAIATVSDLEGVAPSVYATELAHKWGVGRQGKDNGILVLIKPKTRESKGEIFIAVGYGLEGAIPDAVTSRIIRNVIIPRFQQGQMYAGINEATDALIGLASGEYTADEVLGREDSRSAGGFVFFIIAFVVMIIMSFFNRKRSHTVGSENSTSHVPPIIFFGSPFSGGGRGSSSGGFGGGFGGFGGGGFGGGGAGGSW
ncbi:MAG: TPM domain-containing protein [Rikenellaceae bacterium]